MFVERNVFHLKFGASREATQLWKDFLPQAKEKDGKIRARLYSDQTGRGYTLVLELMYDSYAELEPSACRLTQLPGWKEFYAKFIPLCESSERTLFRLQGEW